MSSSRVARATARSESTPGLVRRAHTRLVRRAWSEREMSRAVRETILERSGFQWEKALLGALAGTALGALATWLLTLAGATNGELYGGVLVVASAVGAALALKSCRVVHATLGQATIAGTLTAFGVLGVGVELGLGVGVGGIVTLAFAIFASFAIGAVDNPQSGWLSSKS